MVRLVLGVGSNLGDRKLNIENAVKKINFLANKRISSFIETSALLPNSAPIEWDRPFLNIAISGDCTLPPLAILSLIKEIEINMGRKLGYAHWSPRIIDIDILLYGNIIFNEASLTIPHTQLFNREFALKPALEIENELVNSMRKKIII